MTYGPGRDDSVMPWWYPHSNLIKTVVLSLA